MKSKDCKIHNVIHPYWNSTEMCNLQMPNLQAANSNLSYLRYHVCSIHHMYVVTKFATTFYWGLRWSVPNWRCASKNNSLFLPRTTTIQCNLLWCLNILWQPNESDLNTLSTIYFKYYTFHVAQCTVTKMCTGQMSYYSSVPKGSKQFVLPLK